MQVTKRSGQKQPLDLNKIHAVLEWACEGDRKLNLPPIKGVSVSEIEMKAQLQMFDKISTKQIHETLIKAAADLISEDTPNYDHVAARLRWFAVRKEAFQLNNPPHVKDVVKKNIKIGVYDPEILGYYSNEEWDQINGFIDHSRDDLFRHAGAEQMAKKYLAQNRKTKQIYESFQFPYILVSAILFRNYPKETRLNYVQRYYDQISQHYVSLPTPIMAGLRTKVKQFSSCTVIEAGDSLDSINATAAAIVEYASRKAGIGLSIGAIRAEGQPVRGGDAVTTGVLPFAKYFAAALKSCSQGAVRGASATFNYPLWHLEFERLIQLKNNRGTEETRLRVVDYCVHMNRVMYERIVNKSHITFFSPEEVPDLYQAFYESADKFRELYEKYEKDPTKTKKQKPASEVFAEVIQERVDTGRIYIFNADLVNERSPFYEPIRLTNLCAEIALPTQPLGDEFGRIALCTLSALNAGKIETLEQLAEASEMAVRGLDEVLSYQDYPNEAARASTMEYRPLGIGIIGLAHFFAKNKVQWGSSECLSLIRSFVDQMAYNLIKTSCKLAEELGPCLKRTKYHDGIFPAELSGAQLDEKWEELRENLKKFGIRNATLMAGMPSETSSQLANETNGVEPPKELITIKGNKDNTVPQVVPDYAKLNHVYETVWNVQVRNYLTTIAEIQVFMDQSISTNTSYNPHRQKITTSSVLKDLLFAYSKGIKTLYYNNILDEEKPDQEDDGCESGACKI